METTKKSTFYTILYELSKSFENLTFSLKRTIDQQNIQILLIYQQHSYSISPEISEKAHQVLETINKARLSQTILTYLQSLINEASSAKTLETLYWLLKKYDVHQYLVLLESAIQSFYGEVKQFGDAPSEIEKIFELPFNEGSPNLKEYIAFIEGLYLSNGEIEIEKIDAEEDILDTTAKESEVEKEEEAKTSSAATGGKVILKPSGGDLVNVEQIVDLNQDVYCFMGKYLTEGDPESHVKPIERINPSSNEFEFVPNGSGTFKGEKREGHDDFLTYKKTTLKAKKRTL